MVFPRRGGPSGHCHSWLSLSKHHKGLRKLIPIYFPANTFTTSSESGDEHRGVPTDSDKISIPSSHGSASSALRELTTNRLSGKTLEENGACSSKLPLVWNIDEGATNHLHDLMDPVLIYKSLIKSPIHWKCVPQLRSFGRKHCAAVCGVIIRKRRKKAKKLYDPNPSVTEVTLQPSLHESEAPLSEDTPETLVHEADSPVDSKDAIISPSSPGSKHPKRQRSDTESVELEPSSEIPHAPSPLEASLTQPDSYVSSPKAHTLESPCEADAQDVQHDETVQPPFDSSSALDTGLTPQVCRFCLREPGDDDKLVRRACSTCLAMLRSFVQRFERLDDLTCLRDTPCYVSRSVAWVPTKELSSKVRERRLQQEYGPHAEDWCVSCKVQHCLKLGGRLTEFCGKRDRKQTLVRSINLQPLEDPAFQHRGRERRVLEYLNLLSKDYTTSHCVPSDGDQIQNTPELGVISRFLDLLWVRPVYLPSREYLDSKEHSIDPHLNPLEGDYPSKPPDSPTLGFPGVHRSDLTMEEEHEVENVLVPPSTTSPIQCSISPSRKSPTLETTTEKLVRWDSFSDLIQPEKSKSRSPSLGGSPTTRLTDGLQPKYQTSTQEVVSDHEESSDALKLTSTASAQSHELPEQQSHLDIIGLQEQPEHEITEVVNSTDNPPSDLSSHSQRMITPAPTNSSFSPKPNQVTSTVCSNSMVNKGACALCAFRENCDPVDVSIRSVLARKMLRNSLYSISIGPAEVRGRTRMSVQKYSPPAQNPLTFETTPQPDTITTGHTETLTLPTSPVSTPFVSSESTCPNVEPKQSSISEQPLTSEEPIVQETVVESSEISSAEGKAVHRENQASLSPLAMDVTETSSEMGTLAGSTDTQVPDDTEAIKTHSESDFTAGGVKPITTPISEMQPNVEKPSDSHFASISACGPCVFQLRRAVNHLLNAFSTRYPDCIAQLMLQPDAFCAKRISAQEEDKSYIANTCLQVELSSMCEACYLYTCLQCLYKQLNSAVLSPAKTNVDFILPVGGPLFLPPNPSDSIDSRTLFERRIYPKDPNLDETTVPQSLNCVCCHTRPDFWSLYEVREPNIVLCSGCLWTFRAGLISSNSAPMVCRIAARLNSAAAATDASLPLLSAASRRLLVDIARLALLISTPCTGKCLELTMKPIWITCPACVVRRCQRLLPLIFPLHAVRWYRRRIKLLTRSTLLEDLDPRLMVPKSEPSDAVTRKHPRRYSLVDVEYVASVIERWLTPPEPPTAVESSETLDSEMKQATDVSSSEEDVDSHPEDIVLTESSGISTTSSISSFSTNESEYGGSSWWDGEELIEPTEKAATDVGVDSSETEPETDEALAETMTASFTPPHKRQRKPSVRAAEAEADAVNRKPARSSSKNTLTDGASTPDVIEHTVQAVDQSPIEEPSEPLVLDTASETTLTVIATPEKPESAKECSSPTFTAKESPVSLTPIEPCADEPTAPALTSVAKPPTVKRPTASPDGLIVHGKRKLKINPRFLDDYDGSLPCLTGKGRRIRDESGGSRGSTSSLSSRASGSSILTRKTYSNRASLLAQKRAHACLNNRGRPALSDRSNLKATKARSNELIGEQSSEEAMSSSDRSVEDPNRVCNAGPRVKQISRPGLKSEESRYATTLSAMVHAARLAAVGAKVPGGTSPNHAALAATARATIDDLDDARQTQQDSTSQGKPPAGAVGRSTSSRSLPERCGQCPACCGLVQPCGTCNNCRSLQQVDKDGPEARGRPCKELICFRRRPNHGSAKSGPRVKLPSNFPSNGSAPSTTPYSHKNADSHSTRHGPSSPTDKHETGGTVSLLDTVPGLARQLECDAWINQPMTNRNGGSTPTVHPKDFFKPTRRANSLEVFSSRPVTPVPGGDLGMRFSGQKSVDTDDAGEDRIRPVEGEVITHELAHHGGYAIVTTMASAPPKEICYACGSGGGQLLFCVSCAEPFHFYCVERQFRPRRKDHFICRNCTECKECRSPAADLRCTRCSGGYHPSCLSDYAPAQSGHRGNWVCPHCTSCVHCGTKPYQKRPETAAAPGNPPDIDEFSRVATMWSPEPSKCAACWSAEARGDICPECDRAYLPSTKQMIQCDTCQLWMHRTCTKLTGDEYEWIARLSPGQLRKFVVNCTVCQNELNQQRDGVDVPGTSADLSGEPAQGDVGDTNKLQVLAHDTLLERMSGLVTSCRRPSVEDSMLPVCSSSTAMSSPRSSVALSPTVFPSRRSSNGLDSRSFRIPQVDGTMDEESDGNDSPQGQRKNPKYRPVSAHASDVLLYEQHSYSPSATSPDFSLDVFAKSQKGFSHLKGLHSSRSGAEHRPRSRIFSEDSPSIHLAQPPISASWVTENESKLIWTTPRYLIYRMLSRILYRLAAHPINSPNAITLRQLLRWLSCTTESLFPWLNVSEMANDVRDILQQTGNELTSVLKHFEKCALIELHELMCPVVARMSDSQVHSYTSFSKLGQRAWNNINRVQNCHSAISHHLKTHHPNSLSMPQKIPPKLMEVKHILAAKAALARLPPSQCYRPHELETMERMRNEAREERWVEHWSALEEELVLQNFQRHLLRNRPTSLSTNAHQPINSIDPDGSSTVISAPGTPRSSEDGVFKESTNDTLEKSSSALESLVTEVCEVTPGLVDLGKQPLTTQEESNSERFYFALEDCWTAASGPTSSRRKERSSSSLFNAQVEEELDSSDEDVRCCLLCGHHGDNNIEGRLLFTGADTWVHVNCALWSNEVYEEETGQLIGLSDALRRGRESACVDCGHYGATMLCSNSHEPTCTLYMQPWLNSDDSESPPRFDVEVQKSVHFACALRRHPPAPRSVFTADRSWFCSPECHQAATRQRLMDAIQSRKEQHHQKSGKPFDAQLDCVGDEEALSKGEYAALENAVADDLEPISLGELLVCRRVFAPSDCFAASLLPPAYHRQSQPVSMVPDDNPGILKIAQKAVNNLYASPNSLAFLQCTGLPAANLVVTIGSLRVDRLGEVREASDALAVTKRSASPDVFSANNYLCPINYRARRIFWSCSKLDARISYTLHIRQTHAINTHLSNTSSTLAMPMNSFPLAAEPSPSFKRTYPAIKYITSLPSSLPSAPVYPMRYSSGSTRPQPTTHSSNVSTTHSVGSYKPVHHPAILRPNSAARTLSQSIPSPDTQTVTSTPASAVPHSASDTTQSAAGSTLQPLKIVNAVSLSATESLPPTEREQPKHSLQWPPRDLSPGCHLVKPVKSSASLVETKQNPASYQKYGFSSSPTDSRKPLTCYPIHIRGRNPDGIRTSTIQFVTRPTATYRIPVPVNARPGTLTTPTKDQQLASQLNGLFQNIPQLHMQPVNGATAIFPVTQPLNPTSSNPRARAPHQLIPQVDGTVDDTDDDYYPSKRSRPRSHQSSHSRKRSGSVTSNDSSTSNRTTASKTQNRKRVAPNEQPKCQKPSQPPLSPKAPPTKRRWIEERNKQQELAQLVSKAKLANHARMYQHEVEKHARTFRLRFSIDGCVRAAPNPSVAWRSILTRVAALREKQGLPSLLSGVADGWTQFGLSHRHVVFLIEQMRGAFQCYRYRFRYHRRKIERLRQKFTPPIPVPEGCARAIIWTKPRLPANHARDPLSFLSCAGNPPPRPLIKPGQSALRVGLPNAILSPNEKTTLLSPTEQAVCAEAARQAASLVAVQLKLPLRVREACIAQAVVQATGFPLQPNASDDPKGPSCVKGKSKTAVQPVSDDDEQENNDESSDDAKGPDEEPDLGTVTTQFKRMVSGPMARYLCVAVHPSHIHGRGLFALRGFREDEMVIEYMGELIRNFVCETREVRYRAAGVDCYMFRIDADLVIDATYAGNAARFINHSCDPNCYAKVITVDDKKHIVILAQRRIYPGEELTYDYRFPKESDKLLCNCGSYNCRRYLN